ncbi:MAG TPA: amidohydrolase family protein, partial [Pirellulaceae bacterium]
MGYTTAFDAAIPPLFARQAHAELDDTPCIDKGFFVLVGNDHCAMDAMARRDPQRLQAYLAWLLGAVRGYSLKLVNPGGVEAWKQDRTHDRWGLDDEVPSFRVTPRTILREMAAAADALQLPHAAHIHANHLGVPGNWRATLATMQALEGHRGHMAHIQFHSYGGGPGDGGGFRSATEPLLDYFHAHPNITVDVGQILFGATTCLTGDGPLGYYLARI